MLVEAFYIVYFIWADFTKEAILNFTLARLMLLLLPADCWSRSVWLSAFRVDWLPRKLSWSVGKFNRFFCVSSWVGAGDETRYSELGGSLCELLETGSNGSNCSSFFSDFLSKKSWFTWITSTSLAGSSSVSNLCLYDTSGIVVPDAFYTGASFY